MEVETRVGLGRKVGLDEDPTINQKGTGNRTEACLRRSTGNSQTGKGGTATKMTRRWNHDDWGQGN